MPYADREIQREYQKIWIAKRKALWFQDKCCRRCGSKKDLELDHIDPSKKWTHRIWSYSWEKIMREVAKCQVLCRDCHAGKTLSSVNRIKKHGTVIAYVKYHCRCIECMKIKNLAPGEEVLFGVF